MPRRTRTGRWLLHWWPLPFAIGLGVYACLVPEPYALRNNFAESAAYGLAALMLAVSCWHPSRKLRLGACWWTIVIMVGRAFELMFNPPVVDAQRTAAGVTFLLTFAYVVTVLTFITELASANGSEESRRWGH